MKYTYQGIVVESERKLDSALFHPAEAETKPTVDTETKPNGKKAPAKRRKSDGSLRNV